MATYDDRVKADVLVISSAIEQLEIARDAATTAHAQESIGRTILDLEFLKFQCEQRSYHNQKWRIIERIKEEGEKS